MKRIAILTISLLASLMSYGQPKTKPEFDVASVRVATQENIMESRIPTLDVAPGTILRISNLLLRDIIMLAYGVGGSQLAGQKDGVALTDSPAEMDRFDIQAKVPADAKKDQIPLMLQALLEDRFKLKVHREPKAVQVYALEVGKAGSKLQVTTAGDREAGCARSINGGKDGGTVATCINMSMPQMAQNLQSLSPAYFPDGPVLDKTGLTGKYDFQLEWMRLGQIEAGQPGPTMFAAVQKLGLSLEKKKETVDMLVVDYCALRPSDN